MVKKKAPLSWGAADQPQVKPRTAAKAAAPKLDGRTLKAKGRTEQFSTRITPETKADLMALARAEDKTMTEVIEAAVAEYKAART